MRFLTMCALSFLVLISTSAFPLGITLGPSISLGSGRMNGKDLDKALNNVNAQSVDIKKFDKKAYPGFNIDFGGFVEFSLMERFSLGTALLYSFLTNTIHLELTEDDSETGLTSREIIKSDAQFKFGYLRVPLTASFTFLPEKGYFVRSGMLLDFVLSKNIESVEEIFEEEWENGNLVESTLKTVNANAVINEFDSFRIGLSVAVGKKLLLGRSPFEIIIEANFPITKSEMYTTNTPFANIVELNEIFTPTGKSDLEQNSGIRLDGFRYGSIQVRFTYGFHILQ